MLVFMPVLGAVLVAVLPGRMAAWLWRLALFFALAALGYAFWLAASGEDMLSLILSSP